MGAIADQLAGYLAGFGHRLTNLARVVPAYDGCLPD